MKKFTTIFVSIVCLVVLLAGCGSAPANAEQPKSEDTKQESVETEVTPETSEAIETPEKTDSSEAVDTTSANMLTYESGISGWYIDAKDGGACLVHRIGPDRNKDVETAFVFDADSGIEAEKCTIVDKNNDENLFLLNQNHNFYILDLNSNELKLIVEGYLDYYYDNDDAKLFYLDLEYWEHVIDWQNSDTDQKTNVMNTSYLGKGSFWAKPNKDFKDRFLEIQALVKSGTDPKQITDVDIMDNGDIYDFNGNYLANIHLPFPFDFSPNLQFYENGMTVMVNETTLQYYRYGEVVWEFELPNDVMWWKVIQSKVSYNVDPSELYSKNVTADEIKSAITKVEVLMYDIQNTNVMKIDDTGINTVCSKCVDFQEFNGVLYWMDFSYKAYTLNWLETNESTEVLSDVVAVADFPDERVGFIIRPDDSRANAKEDGMYLYRP